MVPAGDGVRGSWAVLAQYLHLHPQNLYWLQPRPGAGQCWHSTRLAAPGPVLPVVSVPHPGTVAARGLLVPPLWDTQDPPGWVLVQDLNSTPRWAPCARLALQLRALASAGIVGTGRHPGLRPGTGIPLPGLARACCCWAGRGSGWWLLELLGTALQDAWHGGHVGTHQAMVGMHQLPCTALQALLLRAQRGWQRAQGGSGGGTGVRGVAGSRVPDSPRAR